MPLRIAIVFDNTLRPETTGIYCYRALQQLSETTHVLPRDLGRVERGQFDAFIYVDDGLTYEIPPQLHPSAWWAIDTHVSFERCLHRARQCDFVFAAQRDGSRRFQVSGIDATWLPLACDPDIHGHEALRKERDWCFIGNIVTADRSEWIEWLRAEAPNAFVGQRYFEEMARTYCQSRIVFNRSVGNDINMRVFEALASGSLLLTNDLSENGQTDLFQNGIHLVTYRNCEEMLERLRYFLQHDEEREEIAARGRQEVLAKHTYRHRMEVILDTLAESVRTKPVAVVDSPRKDPTYFEWDRPDVLALVPLSARRVADLGCGGGRLGELIKARQSAEVWGVERDSRAAHRASQRLDHVLNADLGEDDWSLPQATLDAIVCADVLEHLRHPGQLLKRCQQWLAPGGCLIASLPNVQHHSVVAGLLDGNLTYEPAGLLDEDHVRLFTRREIEKLFFRSGFRISEWTIVPGEGFAEWERSGKSTEIRIGGLQIKGLDRDQAESFFVYQYLVRAEPVAVTNDGLTSIILVTCNQLNYTRQCVESLRFRTGEPIEIIAVDNGSTDGTVAYFESQPDVTLIVNRENRGFPAAVNQGLSVASGRQVVLLNNDTILTTGWLRRMLDTLQTDPSIGLVGPMTNAISGPQQIDVSYRNLASLDGFAWDHGGRHAGKCFDLDRLVGFCLLIRREVIDTIGLFDERFGLGNFEDDDYCRRARQAGFRTVVATSSFVHHFGSVTFKASNVDFGALLRENERKFVEKWRVKEDSSDRRPSLNLGFTHAEGGGLRLVPPNRPRLSLCMIVRDNEHTIRPCLESIRPWVDEMIVVDTGSHDATPQICAELGARVYSWPWRDDFSAARNESLSHATGEWLFWMDSDDTIPVDCGQRLRTLADGPHDPSVLGYVIQVHCPGPRNDTRDVTAVDHVKLFRNRSDLRFEHRIHEQILPAIRRAGGEVAFTDIHVVHSGADHTPEGRRRKLDRDFKLLKLDLDERPDHPFVLFNLGMTHADVQQHRDAVNWLTRCIDVSRPEESHLRKAYALLTSSLMQLNEFAKASMACQRGREQFPEDQELLFRHAMLAHESGCLDEAVSLYHQVLTPRTDRHFLSIDVGLSGYKTRHNLALVYEELGQSELAESQWRTILRDQPDYVPARVGLVEALVRQNRFEAASHEIESLFANDKSASEAHRMRARLAEVQHGIDAAAQALRLAIPQCPDDPELFRDFARHLHTLGQFESALAALDQLTHLLPEDASAWHNRGVILGLLDRTDESEMAFSRAASLRHGHHGVL
ncbi:MAG: glycosyltransferase [Planctomycetaceae bacterium]